MKFVEVVDVPRRKTSLIKLFDEFMSEDKKVARLDSSIVSHYSNVYVATSVIRHAANYHGYPVNVYKRKDEIYFERRDM